MSRRLVWTSLVLLIAALAAWLIVNRLRPTENRVRLQLSGPVSAQFAGYYAAKERGFYSDEGLDVRILTGGRSVSPLETVVGRRADIGVGTVPALLSARDRGLPLVNIAQIFQYSGLRLVALKASGIKGAADLRGRKVGVWFGGSEVPLLATLEKYRIDRSKQVTLVSQPLNMTFLLNRLVDAAMALTYREYSELRKAGVDTNGLTVIDFNREGTALLEDGLVAREDWITNPRRLELAGRVLKASLRGWEFCRDRPEECVAILLKHSPNLDRNDQTLMMQEVNRLIWGPPAPKAALGFMDPDAFERTAELLRRFGAITKPAATTNAYTHKAWTVATEQ